MCFRIGGHENGADPAGTNATRGTFDWQSNDASDVSQPHAVAFTLFDLGLMTWVTAVSGMVISSASGLDLTFSVWSTRRSHAHRGLL